MEARQEYESKYTAEKNYPLLMEIYRRALTRDPGFEVEEREPDSSVLGTDAPASNLLPSGSNAGDRG